jgi:glutathione S-transferase
MYEIAHHKLLDRVNSRRDALWKVDSFDAVIIRRRATTTRETTTTTTTTTTTRRPSDMATPTLRLRYFNIEGPAEKSRLALRLGKIPFEDVRVSFDDWRSSVKATTPYGQLPLLDVGGDGAETRTIAQSDAILRYCGRLATSRGVALYDDARADAVDEALALVEEMSSTWYVNLLVGMDPRKIGHCVEEDAETFKGSSAHDEVTKRMRERWMREEYPRYVGFIEQRVRGGKFMCGDAVSIADCALIPLLRRFTSGQLDHVPKDAVSSHPELQAYFDRFHALPEVKAWYAEREAAKAAA